MAGIKPTDFSRWVTETTRTVARIERALAKARVPSYCTSTVRPDPSVIPIGARLFETDTNRSIFVNATQSGYVDSLGNAV